MHLPTGLTAIPLLLFGLLGARSATGDLDLNFDPGSFVDSWVRVVAVQNDGKILIGGDFTTIRRALRSRIARLTEPSPRAYERSKMGLSTPMDRWLRCPLCEWAEAHLSEDRLRREGFFEAGELRRLWNQHQQGKRERGYMLWSFLMY